MSIGRRPACGRTLDVVRQGKKRSNHFHGTLTVVLMRAATYSTVATMCALINVSVSGRSSYAGEFWIGSRTNGRDIPTVRNHSGRIVAHTKSVVVRKLNATICTVECYVPSARPWLNQGHFASSVTVMRVVAEVFSAWRVSQNPSTWHLLCAALLCGKPYAYGALPILCTSLYEHTRLIYAVICSVRALASTPCRHPFIRLFFTDRITTSERWL